MVLAAVYLIRLAIDSGMLTPGRQVTLAILGAFALIGLGLGLRRGNREYASLLPAGGIVILFASIYGGTYLLSSCFHPHGRCRGCAHLFWGLVVGPAV